ncbi:MAG TPA: Fe-S cluster assembly protein SufB, partial [Anaerolineae bacterium]|nr:Fe-S cluster assembly protein SufB [Anaerolineae bacterium]
MATEADRKALEGLKDEYAYGWKTEGVEYTYVARKGLDHDVIDQISDLKGEPDWMREFRHKALDIFWSKPMPNWGPDLSEIDFDDIYYYIKPTEAESKGDWDDVPSYIRETFDRLGVPEAERKFLAGLGAQFESEMVYHSLREEWEKQGVIFVSIEDGLREYPDLFKEYFATVVPPTDNKFAAL